MDVGVVILLKPLRTNMVKKLLATIFTATKTRLIPIVNSKDKLTGKFDVISCVHVLEHFPNPIEELSWMASMLTPDGILFIEIPFTRLVFPPHPILFSRESVFIMMKYLKAKYIFYDMEYISDNGLIFCQPNHPTYYADIHPTKIEYFRENDEEET